MHTQEAGRTKRCAHGETHGSRFVAQTKSAFRKCPPSPVGVGDGCAVLLRACAMCAPLELVPALTLDKMRK
ncbi:hypothetical protein BTO02_26865 [Paraburkholderia sp. SOS3]|nr:hypothetical protein BTO02_26865 [Paraburkholderia sp. SOS3]